MSRQIPLLLLAVVAGAPLPAAAQACLVPENQIVAGGPGKDSIPALTQPPAVPAAQGDAFLEPSSLVLGVVVNGEAKAYPYFDLGNRAVVNDDVNGRAVLVVYDAPGEMAIAFDRVLGDQTLSFELVEESAFPFHVRDLETGSLWTLRGEAVEGPLAGQRLPQVATFSAMWFAWASVHPGTEIFQP